MLDRNLLETRARCAIAELFGDLPAEAADQIVAFVMLDALLEYIGQPPLARTPALDAIVAWVEVRMRRTD